MILDCKADLAHALSYTALDMDRGVWLDKMPVFYIDDEAGIYRVYLTDADGKYYVDPVNRDEPAWEERRARIEIVPKAE